MSLFDEGSSGSLFYGPPMPDWDQAVQMRALMPQHQALANLEHFLWAKQRVQDMPFWGPIEQAIAIPGYAYAKRIGQPLGFFEDATPADWSQIGAGFGGLLGGLRENWGR